MVFLNKTRERGLKILTKEKKKPQKQAEKPAHLPTTTLTVEQPQQDQQPLPSAPIHVNLVIKTPKAEPLASALPAPQTQSPAGSPWWVSDVTFLIEGKKIPGHKVVLQSRSQYFTKLFQASPADANLELEITHFSYDIFSQFVRWVYGGKKEISPQDAPELARCAEHFEAPELQQVCQKLILEEATKEQLQPPHSPLSQEHFPAPATLLLSQQPPPPPLPVQHSSLASFSQELPPPSTEQPLFHPLPTPASYIDHHHQLQGYHPSSTLILGDERLEFVHHHPQFHLQSDDLMGEAFLGPLSEQLVMTATFGQDFDDELGYDGMNLWSNDPVLFNQDPSSADPMRTMQIY